MKTDHTREALESMVWQFGYHGTKDDNPTIWTGGLSALEEAFDALGWDDPHILEDNDGVSCDVEGCYGEICASGTAWRDTGYWQCCMEHSSMARDGKVQPSMKPRAIQRESTRDKITGIRK